MPAASKKKSSATPNTAKVIDSQSSSSGEGASVGTPEKMIKLHKRSRSGCFTCRLRRKKCDEKHPSCGACSNLCVKCEYKRPIWWGNAEQRRIQKERIKNKIKQTKMNERNGSTTDPLARSRNMPATSPLSPVFEFNRPGYTETYDLFSSHLPTPGISQQTYAPYAPYEIDVKTERQTFINDAPLRHDSSISTFSTFAAPQLNAPLPTFPGEEWFQDEYFPQTSALPGIDPALCEQSIGQTYTLLQSNIPVSDHDRPLLDHFIHNVLRIIFPVVEAHQRGHTRAQAILRALETNKCYLHCCLSVAAIHLKTTEGIVGEQIDHDIMRHRFEAVSHLCQALGEDINHEEILDATLAMIFFHCSVGPADDYLPDIPWFDHFQAASNLVNRLGLPTAVPDGNPYIAPPFSMTLTSWIDILGSTMEGKTPQFAHTYRSKHLSGSSSGLRELMGCDDRVMYLISEIACLDALKNEGRVDAMAVCSHVSALGRQLEFTEPADRTLEHPYSPTTGAIRPDVLSKNITTVFRIAARIYLCSLVPGFDRNQPSNLNLVAAVADTLNYIPSGPNGFDRSLVWPLLITGAFSAPTSPFRAVLAERAALLGDHADLGSFGRMYRLLQEVWRLTDDHPTENPYIPEETSSSSSTTSSSGSPVPKVERSASPESSGAGLGMREIKKQQVHWRDVMQRNGWHHLLI
ncbi:Zn(II)2Cys6 transcription factor [Aspergillus clavatus NRRL 1]|uniref:C6 sexual development transcription factor (Pro1), putative n=1 Tax=Aspergillus clavatus (strain ATCC 1007 / CBS 513.65 / DSM 816 / NCTC 3887 / NRRL 1 / QM 1276 / 107) TaxID=344612 RepID=A1CHS0_ASPCL|nr:C6 sexual development transcription factor (Pro1), putative [Aspergillus clavatus NRRL 1]EAW10425.1 C6 sexual development transcription factor (Pro1), putative [Aspergillus clavatus NRRL 1]